MSIVHEQNSVGIVMLQDLHAGDICRSRKENPCQYYLRLRSIEVIGAQGKTVEALGVNLQTGELIVYNHQVIRLPAQDALHLKND